MKPLVSKTAVASVISQWNPVNGKRRARRVKTSLLLWTQAIQDAGHSQQEQAEGANPVQGPDGTEPAAVWAPSVGISSSAVIVFD